MGTTLLPGAPGHKSIVICCDGTGSQVSGNLSNVLKLFRILVKDERQRVFYDPGVGTIGRDSEWNRLATGLRSFFGLATGFGLDDNIIDAYRYLATVYEPGDRIFLFGFSRGAYTVRALAGMVHMIGLLNPDQLNVVDYALTAYKRSSEKNDFHIAWDFARTTASRRAIIHFVGAWDTVASMIVPRPDRFYLPSLRTLPYTRRNPSVRAFRHAMAIDERRRMFRLNRWDATQDFVANPFSNPPVQQPQDICQMWFAGVHTDVGGAYPESESGLSKIPLAWMIEEAVGHGLRIDDEMFSHLVEGLPRPGATHHYVGPDPCGPLHNSLRGPWWILEILPRSARWREWPRPNLFGFYWPFGEPRLVRSGETIHGSVAVRQAASLARPYRPPNLPQRDRLPPEGIFSRFCRTILYLFAGAALIVAALACALWLWRHA